MVQQVRHRTFDEPAAHPSRIHTRLRQFVRSEEGDDLIEYALLGTLVGLIGLVAFNLLSSSIFGTYNSWDHGIQNLWIPPDPAGSGS